MLAQFRVARIKRGLPAPLLFLALILAGYASADASPAFCVATLLLLALAASGMSPVRAGATPLALCVGAFSVWIAATNQLANPSYSAAASYHAALLLGGYLIGRRSGPETALAYRAALAFVVALAGWALVQQVWHAEQRAHGLLITPATLASIVNLVLAPGLVLVVFGMRRLTLVAPLAVLATALTASQSRGGWIALAVALAIAALMAWRGGLRPTTKGATAALGILVTGMLAGWLLRATIPTTSLEHAMLGVEAGQSLQARLELSALAIQRLAHSSWLFGDGYSAFYYVLEAGRGAVPMYDQAATYFVHNDYLQTLLELGVPGLLALLLLVVLPFGQAWRALAAPGERGVALIALVAGIASMAVHGLVDFPFFIPLCVLMYGAALGLCDVLAPPPLVRLAWLPVPAVRVGLAALTALAIWILGTPLAAEAAALYAQREWRALDQERAAYWFEAARRLDPRDWRYHWYAGQFWANLAAARADPAAARLADIALAASVAANTREVRSLHERIVLHRRLRKLLAAPADPETLRAWSARAVRLSPTHPGVLAERARVLKQFPPPMRHG